MTRGSIAGLGLQLLMWCLAVVEIWRTRGLFNWLGIDYGFFWASARAFVFDGPVSAYDHLAVAKYIQPLADYYGPMAGPLNVGPTPYPPIFVLLFTPFVVPPPVVGFVLWTMVNLALACYVLRGLAARFPRQSWAPVLIALTFFPLAYTLFVGQVTVLLLLGLYQAYRAFEKGQDFRGGLWTGILLIKPQYAFLLVLVLFFKRRWAAIRGLVIAGLALLVSSVLILGTEGFLKYLGTLNYASGFRSVDPIVYPEQMISWRGLLVNFLPGVSEVEGFALTLILSAITASTLLVVWRGQWDPREKYFATRIFATMLVTLLVSFHSHTHGAALLVVPGMVLAAQRNGPPLVQAVLRASIYVPTVIFALTGWVTLVAIILVSLMLLALTIIFLNEMIGTKVLASAGAVIYGKLHRS